MMRFEGLCAGYDGQMCLTDVSGTLASGDVIGIVGPNGSGKSTLLKALTGILPPMAGRMMLDERDMASMSVRERARFVSYLPQTRTAPELTAWQLAAHGRYPHMGARRVLSAQDRDIVTQAMQQAGALALKEKLVSHLSGGERQRVYLAMLLAQQTPVMLLDEPAASLDPAGQFALMALLRGLAEEGRAVALVIHDLPLALSCCDALWVMKDGRLVDSGTPQMLLSRGVLQHIFGVEIVQAGEGLYAMRARTISPEHPK